MSHVKADAELVCSAGRHSSGLARAEPRHEPTRKAHENVQLVVKTHQNLRNDESFEEVRSKSNSQVIIKPKQSDK